MAYRMTARLFPRRQQISDSKTPLNVKNCRNFARGQPMLFPRLLASFLGKMGEQWRASDTRSEELTSGVLASIALVWTMLMPVDEWSERRRIWRWRLL